MNTRILSLSLLLLNRVAGFAPVAMIARRQQVILRDSLAYHLDEDYRYLLAKAKECAYSDSGSEAEARTYLNKILEFESNCLTGVITGEACENVDYVADIVSHLREKIGKTNVSVIKPTNLAGVFPVAALLAFAIVFASTVDWGRPDVTPFTLEEWVWATKNGYLHTMVAHLVRNGGL